MLLEFSCSNHKSIRGEILFSTLAVNDNILETNIQEISGLKILKSAVIYGANGSGKSNFIDALTFVRDLVINSISYQLGQSIKQQPHKLNGFSRESSYKIQFITKGTRYVFGFSIKNMLITNEYLYYFPNNRQTKIFERNEDSFTSGSKFRGKFTTCKDVIKPNRLMLSCVANFSSVKEATDAFAFFSNDLVIYTPNMQDNWLNYSLYQMYTDEKVKASVLKFLSDLGTGIKNIKISIDHKKSETYELPTFLSDNFQRIHLQQNFESISAKIIFENFETDLIQEESIGIKKLISILYPLFEIMNKEKVFIWDDLDANFHDSLVYELVKLFIKTKNENLSQLIFTTHKTSLLNLNLFRRDQIWFTELKSSDRSTDLYSLIEIKNVRKEENFNKGYISGKYGAIPIINLNFKNIEF